MTIPIVNTSLVQTDSSPPDQYLIYDQQPFLSYPNGTDYFIKQEPPIANVVRFLQYYCSPCIAISGIIGNLVGLAGIRRVCNKKHRSCCLYSVGLIISYTLHLFTVLDKWFANIGYGIYDTIGGWCQFVTFLGKGCEFLTQWYAVCLAVDGAVWIADRHRLAPIFCTVRWARSVLAVIGAIGVVVYINISITYGEIYINGHGNICHVLPTFKEVVFRLDVASAFVNSLLPLIIIMTSVTITSVAVWKRYRRNRKRFFRQKDVLINRPNSTLRTTSSVSPAGPPTGGHSNKARPGSVISTMSDNQGKNQTESCIMTCDGNASSSDRCQLTDTRQFKNDSRYSAALITVFLVCNAPFHLYIFYDTIKCVSEGPDMTNLRFFVLSILAELHHLSEASPVWCLLLMSRPFRVSALDWFKDLIHRGCCTIKRNGFVNGTTVSLPSEVVGANDIELVGAY